MIGFVIKIHKDDEMLYELKQYCTPERSNYAVFVIGGASA